MICEDCGQDMLEADSCNCVFISVGGVLYERNTTYFDYNERCHDCNIVNKGGNVHHLGCDVERCPICGDQLISCGCL